MNREFWKKKAALQWATLRLTAQLFTQYRITKLSAALAYYTIFSLPPLLLIVIGVGSLFFGEDAMNGQVYGLIADYVGKDSAIQIQTILQKIALDGSGFWPTVIGGITLLVGATTLFGEIQDSINFIWGLKAKPKKGLLKLMLNRALSFGMILVLGFLLVASLLLNSLVDLMINQLKALVNVEWVILIYTLNFSLIFLLITILFAFIFKVLPDAKIKWRNVFPGAIATALLFMVGKYLISL